MDRNEQNTASPLIEGVDYTVEEGRWVFTREHHLKRGHCCGSGCRHCPYEPGRPAANTETCPRCQRQFACHVNDCWCAGVAVPMEALIEMRQAYESCVCPECLRHFAEKHRETTPQEPAM